VVNHYARMAAVPSQHENRPRAFRPAGEEWDPAAEVFTSRGIVPGEFLRACLRWLASDPDGALAALEAHWPARRPLGRPRKPRAGGAGGG
jgi:hypothetical protein